MSDPRILRISLKILEVACDQWNKLLASGAGEQSEIRAAVTLASEIQAEFSDSIALQSDGSPESQGQRGTLAWLQWFSSKLSLLPLSLEDRGTLESNLNRAISLLSSSRSIHQSVEAASRRQVYELAYGLTHEINNPLGNIVARAQQLLSKSKDPLDRKSLATVVDQGMRAHEMLAELMRAVQPRRVELLNADLTLVVREAFESNQVQSKLKNLTWDLKDTNREIWAKVNRAGILEALRLISQNAIDACREGNSVQWSVKETDDQVQIVIEDDGPGLTSEAVSRAFDLFYSGREAGRGLGISLAVVRRLVLESQGEISLTSQRMLGCRVEMRFPKFDPQAQGSAQLAKLRKWTI